MTIGYYGFIGGESRSERVDCMYAGTGAPASWSIVTSPVKTGTGAWTCLINGLQHTGPFPLLSSPWREICALMGWVNLTDSPAVAFPLMGSTGGSGRLALECNTSRKVRLVKLGSGASIWTGRTALTGFSSAQLPIGAWMHLAWFLDLKSLSSGPGNPTVWSVLMLDESEQWAVDAGQQDTSGFYCPTPGTGSVNAGIAVHWDDLAGLLSTNIADAAYSVNWPKPRVTRQLPIGDDPSNDQWTGVPDDSTEYTNWDDATGDDGDTTYNTTSTTSQGQASSGQSAATLGIDSDTLILYATDLTLGPYLNFVSKTVSGNKFNAEVINSLGTGGTVANPGSAYKGDASVILGKSGGWVPSDLANLYFGLKTKAQDHDMAWRVTMLITQWLSFATTLPLTTAPPGVARGHPWAF